MYCAGSEEECEAVRRAGLRGAARDWGVYTEPEHYVDFKLQVLKIKLKILLVDDGMA